MKGLSHRLDHLQEYYFSQKLREVEELRAKGYPVINMGIGSPDLPPAPEVIEALKESASQVASHGYQGYQGILELRKAMSDFYAVHYRVEVDPQGEILPLLGSKEGIMHISMAFLDVGDEVLVPDPGYPTYAAVTRMLQAVPRSYTLTSDNGWYPDFEALEKLDLSKVKLMWCNYPNMPTGAKATMEIFEKLVALGRKHQILIVHDNPYSFILQENPLSILQIEGAKDVALELNSLSKTSNLAGWRVGMVLGKKEWIHAITKVKSNMDSGMFLGIQHGAIKALQLGKEWYESLNTVYATRRQLIWKLVDRLGLSYDREAVGMFVWAKVAEEVDARTLVDELLYQKHLFVTPGEVFGEQGRSYLRFSLCVSEQHIAEVLERFEQ